MKNQMFLLMLALGLFACNSSDRESTTETDSQNTSITEAPTPEPQFKEEFPGPDPLTSEEDLSEDKDFENRKSALSNDYSKETGTHEITVSNVSSGQNWTNNYATDLNDETVSQASGSSASKITVPIKHTDKIVKEGFMSGQLKDYAKDKSGVMDVIKKSGAYISSENELKEAYKISDEILIRIESSKFDLLVVDLEAKLENLDYKRINATDVSEEYYDLQTRLKTKREIEKRYLEFLAKAKNVEELLQVEGQIRIIREEIESKEGRLQYLADRVSYSMLTLTIYQDLDYSGPPSKRPGFFNRVADGFQTGWKGILNFFIFVAYIWPIWLGLIVMILVLRFLKAKGKWPFRKRE